jgi:hypothetical protein
MFEFRTFICLVKVALLPNNATFIIFVKFFEIMFFGKAQSQKKKKMPCFQPHNLLGYIENILFF